MQEAIPTSRGTVFVNRWIIGNDTTATCDTPNPHKPTHASKMANS